MKTSNKVLLGGFLLPIVFLLGTIIFFTVNGTDDPEYQIRDGVFYDFNLE